MAKRVNMTLAVRRLIRDVAERLPELAHVRASRVLVVAGAARGASRASIRGAALGGPPARRRFLRVRGRRVLYVVTLRPLWFATSTPEERVSTILHELYHVSTRFDGSLHRDRRHAQLPRAAYDERIRALLRRYLAAAPAEVIAPFGHEGIVKVRMWLRMPRAEERRGSRSLDVDDHLFDGYMPLRAPAPPPRARARVIGRTRAT
ncbi:MAG: putative metallopeptidase [Anaeromyxobacteraceae bacterium]